MLDRTLANLASVVERKLTNATNAESVVDRKLTKEVKAESVVERKLTNVLPLASDVDVKFKSKLVKVFPSHDRKVLSLQITELDSLR